MGPSQSVSTMGQLQLPVIVLALKCALVVRSDQVILELNELSLRQEPRGHSRLRDHVRVPVWGWPTLPDWQPAASGQIEGLHGALNNGNFAATQATPTKGSHVLGTNANGAPGGTFRRPARFSSRRTLWALGALDCAGYRAVAEL